METFLRQVLNEDADITGLEEVLEAAKLFMKVMDSIAARTRKTIWEAPLGFSLTHLFQSRVTCFLSTCFKDSSLFEMAKGVLISRISAKWRLRFHSIDSETLLEVHCAAKGG